MIPDACSRTEDQVLLEEVSLQEVDEAQLVGRSQKVGLPALLFVWLSAQYVHGDDSHFMIAINSVLKS
jgi:hypothetical protein